MNKVAIVGSHPDTRHLAPYDDPAFEIWVFNEAGMKMPGAHPDQPELDWCGRWDVCFQLHKPEVYMSPNNFADNGHWEWLQKYHGKRPIYMQDFDELVPNCRVYPLDEIIERLPGAKIHLGEDTVNWFDSTPVYALALALHMGYEEIHTWGVELSSNTEYFRQLPNWVYWCGVAAGMGVKIVHHSGQKHFIHPLYGYNGEVQLSREFFKSRHELLDKTYHKQEYQLKKLKDRIDAAMLDGKPERVAEITLEMRNLAIEAGTYSGATAEAKRCWDRLDPIPRQEFERRAAQAQKDGEGHRENMLVTSGRAEYVWNVWRVHRQEAALNQLRQLTGQIIQAAFDLGAMLGIHRENLEYMAELDKLTDAAGGEHTLSALGLVKNGDN